MRVYQIGAAAMFAVVVLAGSGQAKTLHNDNGPAESPPGSYTGNQFVDSQGCVYMRAGYAGQVTWVPRVSRGRKVMCGFRPTFAAKPAPKAVVAKPVPKAVAAKPVPRAVATKPVAKAKPAPVAVRKPQPKVVAAPKPVTVKKKAVKKRAPTCKGASELSTRYINDGRNGPVRCGPQTGPIYEQGAVTLKRKSVAVASAAKAPSRVPKGYRYAWKDGRLNPNRAKGTPAGQAAMDLIWTRTVPRRLINRSTGRDVTAQYAQAAPATAPQGAPVQAYMSTKSMSLKTGPVSATTLRKRASPTPATAAHFVQVASFGQPANAATVIGKLQRLRLPVRVVKSSARGKSLQTVFAGPFSGAAQVNAALGAIRKAGYRDAFLR